MRSFPALPFYPSYISWKESYFGQCILSDDVSVWINWLGVYSQWKIHLPARGNKFSHVEKKELLERNFDGALQVDWRRGHAQPISSYKLAETLLLFNPPWMNVNGTPYSSSASPWWSSRQFTTTYYPPPLFSSFSNPFLLEVNAIV